MSGDHASPFTSTFVYMHTSSRNLYVPTHQRLVLHRARIDTAAGREAFLKCLAVNKLDCVALGACTWFEGGTAAGTKSSENARGRELQSGRWWQQVCDTIRMNSFRLQELVVEGLGGGKEAWPGRCRSAETCLPRSRNTSTRNLASRCTPWTMFRGVLFLTRCAPRLIVLCTCTRRRGCARKRPWSHPRRSFCDTIW